MTAKPAIVTLSAERKAPTVTPDGASAEPEAPGPPPQAQPLVASSSDGLASSLLWSSESAATNTPLPPLADVVAARRRCVCGVCVARGGVC